VRCRKKNRQWGAGVLLSTFSAQEMLALTGQAAERAQDPTAVLLAYVYFYNPRGGGIEIEIKEDQQALHTAKRSRWSPAWKPWRLMSWSGRAPGLRRWAS